MFLKNRNIISKTKRSQVTDYAALKPHSKIILQAIAIMLGALKGSSCWIPLWFAIYDCLFQRRDYAHDNWRLAQGKTSAVTSWGSHCRLLERAIINVQAPGDRTNPPVL